MSVGNRGGAPGRGGRGSTPSLPISTERKQLLLQLSDAQSDIRKDKDWKVILKSNVGELSFMELFPLFSSVEDELQVAGKYLSSDSPNEMIRIFLNMHSFFAQQISKIEVLSVLDPGYTDGRATLIADINVRLTEQLEQFRDKSSLFDLNQLKARLMNARDEGEIIRAYRSQADQDIKKIEEELDRVQKLYETLQIGSLKQLGQGAETSPIRRSQHIAVALISFLTALIILFISSQVFSNNLKSIPPFQSDVLNAFSMFGGPIALAILSILFFKISFASYHNYLIRQHREYLLNSLHQALESVKTDVGKDAIMVQIFSAVCVHQSTGFTKTPIESGLTNNPFREILDAVQSE